MSVDGYVTDMLVRAHTSDELHEQVSAEKIAREEHAVSAGRFSDEKEAIRADARAEHRDIERAVDWIEAHPNATQYEPEEENDGSS